MDTRISSRGIRRLFNEHRSNINGEEKTILILLMDPDDLLNMLLRDNLPNIPTEGLGYNLPKSLFSRDLRRLISLYPIEMKIILTNYYGRSDIKLYGVTGTVLLSTGEPFEYGYMQYMYGIRRSNEHTYRSALLTLDNQFPSREYRSEIDNPRSLDTIPNLNMVKYDDPRMALSLYRDYIDGKVKLSWWIINEITYPNTTQSIDALRVLNRRSIDVIGLSLIGLLLNKVDTIKAIQRLKDKTPYIYGFKLDVNDYSILVTNNVRPEVIKAFSIHTDTVTPDMLEYVLQRNTDIGMEDIYYYLLHQLSIIGNNKSEINILESLSPEYVSCKRRLNAIRIIGNSNGNTDTGCHNDYAFSGDRIKDIPSFLIYGISSGFIRYCMPISDIYHMTMNNIYKNPWTNEVMDTEDTMSSLLHVMKEGYPIAYSTYADFNSPVEYNSNVTISRSNLLLPNTYNIPLIRFKDIPLVTTIMGNNINDIVKDVYPRQYCQLNVTF